jgi:hypothetical protein
MKLYHGTIENFDTIDLSKSKPYKDFGKGFYLSDNYNQALNLANYKAIQFNLEPIVLTYNFDENFLKNEELNVLTFDSYSREWAEFVFDNRNADKAFTHDYDIVYGPIANDKVGAQMRLLKEHNISLEVFLERLKFFKGITFQYMFATDKAINLLTKL